MAEALGARSEGPDTTGEAPSPAVGPSPLFVWATGSFHAAFLVAALVAGLHRSGAAGDLLEGVGTLPGALAYLYLWGVTLWTTRQALRAAGVSPGESHVGVGALRSALVWGGVTGGAFFGALFVVLAGSIFVRAGLDAVGLVVLIGVGGGLLAVLVGALVGGLLALVDLAALRATDLLVGAEREDGPRDRA
jgi:hypothetical protein